MGAYLQLAAIVAEVDMYFGFERVGYWLFVYCY
jgi:hypothetical protein